jgi:hypothetical protein
MSQSPKRGLRNPTDRLRGVDLDSERTLGGMAHVIIVRHGLQFVGSLNDLCVGLSVFF